MSQFYNPRRSRNFYKSNDTKPFKLSRSKIEFYLECPYCFYMDNKIGIRRPPSMPFNLNKAVDALLKKEFDTFRNSEAVHPLIAKYGIDARPVSHELLDQWRANFTGIQFLHEPTNFLIYGAIDDLWQNSQGEFIVVDYKATSKAEAIITLNEDWHAGYKRQMEVYQWLLRRNRLSVSNTGYFVYCNGKIDRDLFNSRLEFDITLIPYGGDDSWIEDVIKRIHNCLNSEQAPASSPECDFCRYREEISKIK